MPPQCIDAFTKKYAEWISKDLSADFYEVSQVKIDMLDQYDTIVYGASLYAVSILGVKLVTQK